MEFKEIGLKNFLRLGMNKENSSQNFQELYLEKYEPEKDVIWISMRVTEKSLSKGIEFGNVNNSIF